MGTYNRSNNFIEEINELKSDLQLIKGMQRAGLDVNNVHEIKTNASYDVLMSMGYPAHTSFYVEFTSNNQLNPLCKPVLNLVGATSGSYINNKSIYIFMIDNTIRLENQDNKALFYVGVEERQWSASNPPVPLTEDVKIKVYMYASDAGSISVWGA